MKIKLWSDYVCPFCYIGKRELERAIKKLGYEGKIEVELKAYQLDPGVPADSEESIYDSIANKYGNSIEQTKAQMRGITARAAEVGLKYDFDKMYSENTFKAHRLVKYAATIHKDKELSERILKSYFEEGGRISKTDVLIELAKEVGIDEKAALEVIQDGQFSAEVLADIKEAGEVGVKGVPFFVLDDKYAISGAQKAEVFEEAVKKVAEEAGLKPGIRVIGSEDSGVCKDGQCEI